MSKYIFNYRLALIGKYKSNFFILLIIMSVIVFNTGRINTFAQEDKVVGAVMDVHSNISDGFYSPGKVAELVREKGLSVLIFGDSALRKWEYGLWPLRNIVKKTYQENSVLRLGVNRYLNLFKALSKNFPDLVFIPGVEVSPFFYWEGSPFSKNFALIDYYKQFLVIGLSPKDYQNMPIVGNRQFFYFSKNTLFSLWPLLLLIFGLRLLKKKVIGTSLTLLGVIFLINSLPFPTSRFNLYQGYQGIKPYQELIDYVNQKGGFIFWAHPNMVSQKVYYYAVEFYTTAHPEYLLLTHDYTGFGVSLKMAEPGELWDKILLEYLAGKRKKPAWIIDAQHTGIGKGIDYARTFFFIKALKQKDIIDALRQGRMYVRFKFREEPSSDLVLREFAVRNLGSGSIQIMLKGNQGLALEPLKIELIRNGKIFRTFEENGSEWKIIVEDNLSTQEPKSYYRLRINSQSCTILSNPVFAELEK